ncbi:hypothetical protein RJ60_13245 [Mesotoga sp. B105.6.4]|nr:hypothetical protein RJ60_13245 [Mesotoga sp. B105.6.4]
MELNKSARLFRYGSHESHLCLSIKNEMRKQAQNDGLSLFHASSMKQLSTSYGFTGPSINEMERNGIPKH